MPGKFKTRVTQDYFNKLRQEFTGQDDSVNSTPFLESISISVELDHVHDKIRFFSPFQSKSALNSNYPAKLETNPQQELNGFAFNTSIYYIFTTSGTLHLGRKQRAIKK